MEPSIIVGPIGAVVASALVEYLPHGAVLALIGSCIEIFGNGAAGARFGGLIKVRTRQALALGCQSIEC